MSDYNGAVAVQPLPRLLPREFPLDIAEAVDHSIRGGLYGEGDPSLVPALPAADVDGTRALIFEMAGRIGRCRRCAHHRQQCLSDGYGTGRDDLPPVHGHLHMIPDDLGTKCDDF